MSPMAETTTTTSRPDAFVAATLSAAFTMRSTSATEDPPYFWTTIGIALPPPERSTGW